MLGTQFQLWLALGDKDKVKAVLKKGLQDALARVTPGMTVSALHDMLRIIAPMPANMDDFFVKFTVKQVVTRDEICRKFREGKAMRLDNVDYFNRPGTLTAETVTHVIRITDVSFLVCNGQMVEFIGTKMPKIHPYLVCKDRRVFAKTAGLYSFADMFDLGFGPVADGVYIEE